MKTEEIVNKIKNGFRVVALPANEWQDFAIVISAIEEKLNISAHGAKEVKKLEELEKLIWAASREYERIDGNEVASLI